VELTSTVSNFGGLGSFGAHILSPAEIEATTGAIRSKTSAPFAVNLWISDQDPDGNAPEATALARARERLEALADELGFAIPELPPGPFHPRFDEQIEALLESRPPVFSFVFGIPSKAILEACRARSIVTIGAATSVAEARALEDAKVDLIVATGFEAGGHRPSFLERAEDSLIGTFSLAQLVSRRVRTPVIAAGGIADGRGVRAAITLGASAAQLGTAFLACTESGAPRIHKEALFSEDAHHTALTRAFTGRLARGIENRFTRYSRDRPDAILPFPVQSWFVSQLKAASVAANRSDFVSLWAGQIAPNLRFKTARELMKAIEEEIDT
jgi:nitronate monooxygenase